MAIYDVLKDVVALATGSNDLELKNKVLELQNEFIKMTDENRELRDKIIELENDRILEADLEFHIDYYYRKSDKRIFCSRCYDDEHKLISLHTYSNDGWTDRPTNFCPKCKTKFSNGAKDSINRIRGGNL